MTSVIRLGMVLLLSMLSSARAAEPPSVQTFFRNPDILSAKLSPSGRWLGVTFASPTSRAYLGVIDLSAQKITLRPLANYSNADIRSFLWVNDLFENSWSNDASRESQLYTLPQMIGDPQKDAALLKDASPVEHAKEMRAPLLMAFGGTDRRVPLDHGRRMRDALRSAGANPQYVVYDGEGHGFLKVENRVDFYTRVEKFLAENLK